MKKFNIILAVLLSLFMAGCTKNEFSIEFKMPKDFMGNYLVSYYASDSRRGFWVEQTASIQDGAAIIGGKTRNPTIVFITDASSNANTIAIYAERGDKIVISGEGSDMWQWSVEGNKLSRRWSEWRKGAAKGGGKALEKSIADFVNANPSDRLSALIMLTSWNRREDPDGFLKLWNKIDADARSADVVELCGAPDMTGVEFTTQKDGSLARGKDPKLKSLVVRSRDNGIDTLNFNKVTASFLYFYADNNVARREMRDSIAVLTKEYPDSAKRIICDISVDTDSVAWTGSIRLDTIKGTVRGWQPKGIAEEEMVKMGVIRLPWMIVKDKTGAETYAGDDAAKALEAFRKEMQKK